MEEIQGINNISAYTSATATSTHQTTLRLDKILEKMGNVQTLAFLNLIVLVVIAVLIAVHWVLVFT